MFRSLVLVYIVLVFNVVHGAEVSKIDFTQQLQRLIENEAAVPGSGDFGSFIEEYLSKTTSIQLDLSLLKKFSRHVLMNE